VCKRDASGQFEMDWEPRGKPPIDRRRTYSSARNRCITDSIGLRKRRGNVRYHHSGGVSNADSLYSEALGCIVSDEMEIRMERGEWAPNLPIFASPWREE
jgi:hypothetical protein